MNYHRRLDGRHISSDDHFPHAKDCPQCKKINMCFRCGRKGGFSECFCFERLSQTSFLKVSYPHEEG